MRSTTVPRAAFQQQLRQLIDRELIAGDRNRDGRIEQAEAGYVHGFPRVVWRDEGRELPLDQVAEKAVQKAEGVWSQFVGDKATYTKEDVDIVSGQDHLLGEISLRALNLAAIREQGGPRLPEGMSIKECPDTYPLCEIVDNIDDQWSSANISASNLSLSSGQVQSAGNELCHAELQAVARALFCEKVDSFESEVFERAPRAKLIELDEATELAANTVNNDGMNYARGNHSGRQLVQDQLQKVVEQLGPKQDLRAVRVSKKMPLSSLGESKRISLYLFANAKNGVFTSVYVRQ